MGAWWLWAACHSLGEAGPLGAQPLPRLLKLAASRAAGFTPPLTIQAQLGAAPQPRHRECTEGLLVSAHAPICHRRPRRRALCAQQLSARGEQRIHRRRLAPLADRRGARLPLVVAAVAVCGLGHFDAVHRAQLGHRHLAEVRPLPTTLARVPASPAGHRHRIGEARAQEPLHLPGSQPRLRLLPGQARRDRAAAVRGGDPQSGGAAARPLAYSEPGEPHRSEHALGSGYLP